MEDNRTTRLSNARPVHREAFAAPSGGTESSGQQGATGIDKEVVIEARRGVYQRLGVDL